MIRHVTVRNRYELLEHIYEPAFKAHMNKCGIKINGVEMIHTKLVAVDFATEQDYFVFTLMSGKL